MPSFGLRLDRFESPCHLDCWALLLIALERLLHRRLSATVRDLGRCDHSVLEFLSYSYLLRQYGGHCQSELIEGLLAPLTMLATIDWNVIYLTYLAEILVILYQ